MSSNPRCRSIPCLTVLVAPMLLAACGGGGGGGDGAPPPVGGNGIPGSGSFAWVLKADGSTQDLRYGLSFVHPQATDVEYVIEPPSAAVTEVRVVASGSVDAAGLRASSLQPYALLYIVGGDVRRVPLQANGTAPASRIARAATTSACSILIDAIDHATPEQSRFVVSTAGADGTCGTSDDGRAEVKFDAALGLVFTPLTSNLPLAVLRDTATLAPRGWISARSASFWSPAPGSTVTLRAGAAPSIDRIAAANYRSVVAESSNGLALIDFAGGDAFTETALTGTTGSGWQGIGHDATSFYLYRNSGAGATAAWRVLKLNRQPPVTTTQLGGAGEIALATMGSNVLYLTVLASGGNQLLSVNKAAFNAPQVLESLGTTGVATVSTSSAGVHQLWRVTAVGSSTPNHAIEMIDETFNKVYIAPPGGFPLAQAESTSVDFTRSENRTKFLFATGYGARAFGDAALTAFDATARTPTALGALPGTSTFGTDLVFANVVTSPSSTGGGFAGRSTNGVVQSSGAKVFSFDIGVANSLRLTTTVR